MPIKLLLVDDHEFLHDSLEIILSKIDDNFKLLKAIDAKSALELINREIDISLVLLDLNLPGDSGADLLKIFTRNNALLPVAILSGSEDVAEMKQCLDHGALGFIPKTSSAQVIVQAIRLILAGGIYIPPQMLQTQNQAGKAQDALALTPRQLEVLHLLISGKTNKEIGLLLGCSESTVKKHITALLKTMGVANRTEAAYAAQQLGYA